MEFCKIEQHKWSSSKRWKGKDNSIRGTHQSNSNGINKSWIHRRKKTLLRPSCLLKKQWIRDALTWVLCVFTSEGCCHHAWSCSWVWAGGEYLALGAFWLLFQHVSQSLQIVHQGPLSAFFRPVWLEQAAKNSNIKVGGIARPLAWRYRERDPVSNGRKHGYTRSHTSQGVAKQGLQLCSSPGSFSHLLVSCLFHPTILLNGLTLPTFARHYLESRDTGESFEGQVAIIQAKQALVRKVGQHFSQRKQCL